MGGRNVDEHGKSGRIGTPTAPTTDVRVVVTVNPTSPKGRRDRPVWRSALASPSTTDEPANADAPQGTERPAYTQSKHMKRP
jgi:hypothetical protein